MNGKERISVIVPSLADAPRAALLDRAIASILNQSGVHAVPIVVVNGGRHDPAVVESLARRSEIRFVHFSYGGLPEARLRGRDSVDTPFFATLDDDDELLPEALSARLGPMLADETIDVVVTNGFRDSSAGREVTDPDLVRFQNCPLEGLMEQNWLNESGGLYRTSTIGREFFIDLPAVVEWTYIAFKLSQSRNIRFVEVPTFVKHATPNSLSHSSRYKTQHPFVLGKMLQWQMPDAIRAKLKQKYIRALHGASVAELEAGNYRSAWRYHLASLRFFRGQQYLPYTRHLVQDQLTQVIRSM